MANDLRNNKEESHMEGESDDNYEGEEETWEDWTDDGEAEGGGGGEDGEIQMLCLFCDSKYSSSNSLFEHCRSDHCFDFGRIRSSLNLDFYGCLKLLNYVRSQVAQNRCWSCGSASQSGQELHAHLHETFSFSGIDPPWDDDMYLKPQIEDDPLLYSFGEDEEIEDDCLRSADDIMVKNIDSFKEMLNDDEIPVKDIDSLGEILNDDSKDLEKYASNFGHLRSSVEGGVIKVASTCENNGVKESDSLDRMKDDRKSNKSSNIVNNEILTVNKSYFGSYGSFGIHREMISDKVRTDAYRQAIVDNPSLLKGAAVLDVGCGTGILSLFAAQAGASMVNAVEASEKMASVASQIAKDNGLLWNVNPNQRNNQGSGIIRVINGMVEDVVQSGEIEPHSIDVLLSEWMGYCLLYESMLSSVLVARDHWLKPGGAILPDKATMFVAGFGVGATSIPFWENVYGFNMSSIGKELVEDAARIPIIDVVNGHDLVTNTAVLQAFDLVTMKPEEVDFTAIVQLEPKLDDSSADLQSKTTQCYGVVLWFETSFTSRFCKEKPTVLSTSPYTPPTHWSQTILTFREPISVSSNSIASEKSSSVGTDDNPAVKIDSRISIARGVRYRSIDISLEVTAVGFDGRKRKWPAQIFNLN